MSFKPIKINSKYGEWTVKSHPFKKGKRGIYYVQAKCSCGVERDVKKNNLLKGTSKSCGCKNKELLKKISTGRKAHNAKTKEQLAQQTLFYRYKWNAKEYNRLFTLTKKQFIDLIEGRCIYCNAERSNVHTTTRGKYFYNGIDRWDNNKGYIVGNTVSCCKRCNFMKKDLSGEEFMEHILSITQNNHLRRRDIKPTKLNYYYNRVKAVATASHDIQTKVGAILISRESGAVMAEGFNGFIRGANDDELPTTRPEKYDYMVHAEMNLLFNCVRHGIRTDNGIIFVSISPCIHCIRGLWQAGIRTVYCKDLYSDFEKNRKMKDLQIDVIKVAGYYKLEFKPKE